MVNRQIDKKKTKQVRIDAGVHRLLKIMAAETGESLRDLTEGVLSELLEIKTEGEYADPKRD